MALLNHEQTLFALPFLLLRPEPECWQKVINRAATFALCALPWVFLRVLAHLYSEAGYFDFGFYLRGVISLSIWKAAGRLTPLAVFEAFRLFWFFPLCAAMVSLRDKENHKVIWLFLVVGCTLSQLMVALDTSRLVGLGFPVILFGLRFLFEKYWYAGMTAQYWQLFTYNLLIPYCYVGTNVVVPIYPLPVVLLGTALSAH